MKSGKSYPAFIIIFTICVLLSANTASAQNAKEASFKRADRLQKLLGLSDLQKAQVLEILIDYSAKDQRRDKKDSFSAGSKKLETLDEEIEQILTVEQAVKFEKIKYSWMGKKRLKRGMPAEPGRKK